MGAKPKSLDLSCIIVVNFLSEFATRVYSNQSDHIQNLVMAFNER